jgi:phosphoserine aminotransferase
VAGQVLKKLLASFPDKVHGQEVVAGRKSAILYDALDAYPEVYKVVPDKNARSRMNICFRVTKVHLPIHLALEIQQTDLIAK